MSPEAILREDALLRKVADDPNMWSSGESGTRPSSAAMKPHDQDAQLSVDVRRFLPDPTEPTRALEGQEGYGLAELRAAVPFDLQLDVSHDPLPDNEAHANISGFGQFSKTQAKRVQKQLALAAVWIQMPAGALS